MTITAAHQAINAAARRWDRLTSPAHEQHDTDQRAALLDAMAANLRRRQNSEQQFRAADQDTRRRMIRAAIRSAIAADLQRRQEMRALLVLAVVAEANQGNPAAIAWCADHARKEC